jgi:hypothetical protein
MGFQDGGHSGSRRNARAAIILPRVAYICGSPRRLDHGMAARIIKARERSDTAGEVEPERLSQNKRPELGRYLLQVDRQTKGSYQTLDAAQAAGEVIKKNYPILQVAVYDSVEGQNTLLT